MESMKSECLTVILFKIMFFFSPEETSSEPIVYVGEEDIESKRRLQELREENSDLTKRHVSAGKDKQDKEKEESKFRKEIARDIKETVGRFGIDAKYNNYDKGDIEDTIKAIRIENFYKYKLEEEEVDKKKKLIYKEPPKNRDHLPKYCFDFSYDDKKLQNFSEISDELSTLLKRQVLGELIDRFKDNTELNTWAEEGFELHKSKDEEKNVCFVKMSSLRVF